MEFAIGTIVAAIITGIVALSTAQGTNAANQQSVD